LTVNDHDRRVVTNKFKTQPQSLKIAFGMVVQMRPARLAAGLPEKPWNPSRTYVRAISA
jgi:hypothetical protein